MDGDFEGELVSYHKSQKLRNNYAEAHNNLGTLYNLQDMHAPAKECFETAIHHNAKYAPAAGYVGDRCLRQRAVRNIACGSSVL